MLARGIRKGLKIDVWINSYIAQGTSFFREGAEKGYLIKRIDGKGVKQIDHWQAGMGIVDFTNPDAVKWYTGKLKTLLDMGVDCFKTDFAERIPVDVIYFDGSDPKTMHNKYNLSVIQSGVRSCLNGTGTGEANAILHEVQLPDPRSTRFIGVVIVRRLFIHGLNPCAAV